MLENSAKIGGKPIRRQTAAPMTIDIAQRGPLCVIRCRGRMVAGLEDEYVRNKFDEIKRLNCTRVLADLEGVPCIGSSGLAFIVRIYTSVVLNSGGRFIVTGATPLVQRVFEVTRLSTIIPLTPDRESGLAALDETEGAFPAISERRT